MTKRRLILISLMGIVLLLNFSCGSKRKDDVLLAEVEGEKLYLSDIYFPAGLSEKDSVQFLKAMVNTWVMDQLMYQDASDKLSNDEIKAIEKKADQARKMMIISALEQKMFGESKNITVSAEEIQTYYKNNPDEFLLKENIVKVNYLKLRKKGTDSEKYKKLLMSDNSDDKTELASLAREKALNYFLEDNVWLYFNDILKEIPIKAENQDDFLKETGFHQIETDSVVYLVRFKDYMLTDSPAPLNLVKSRIQSVLEAKKKNQLLQDYRNKMYENALKEEKVTLHIN